MVAGPRGGLDQEGPRAGRVERMLRSVPGGVQAGASSLRRPVSGPGETRHHSWALSARARRWRLGGGCFVHILSLILTGAPGGGAEVSPFYRPGNRFPGLSKFPEVTKQARVCRERSP